jgi:hypothetical protein
MSESKNKIDFKMLDYERVGGDFVAFKIEDGALVRKTIKIHTVRRIMQSPHR